MSSPIGGFFPIPLAMMIPFMATQSLIMGDAFGRSFQYGKRKISAMSNEEFNDLTTEKIAQQIFAEYKNIIPSLNQALVDSQELQKKVVDELLSLPSNFLADVWDNIANPNKKDTSFIPNSNNPADSRTWAPGWSPSQDQDFNPEIGQPQPSPTPQDPSVGSRRDPPTDSVHVTTHNAIMAKYQEQVQQEKFIISALARIKQLTPARNRSETLQIQSLNKGIASNKQRILQIIAMLRALQINHKAKYGHDVKPWGTPI